MRRPGGSTWEERFLGSSSEIETYVFTKVEARATFTLSLGFRVCARAKASRMGHDNIWYSRPRKFGAGSRKCKACSNGHGLIRYEICV